MKKKRILVVDDDWAILELLKFRLKRRGYQVMTARNEREFWLHAFEFRPDLVILDIWLKTKLGTDLYENVLEFGFDPDIPVIFVTALLDEQPPRRSSAGGQYALYGKPFNFEELLTEIERLLHRAKQLPLTRVTKGMAQAAAGAPRVRSA